MDSIYAQRYKELYAHHWWWRAREAVVLSRVAELMRRTPAGARILDVGCGAGLFFAALSRFGDVAGIEADSELVAQSGQWRPLITLGTLDHAYASRDSFDLVLMLDVIEHLSDPTEMLRTARRVLRPTGRLVLTVPAFDWLWTRHDELNHHYRRYSARALRQEVAACGFEVLSLRYLFHSLVLAKLAARGLEAIHLRRGDSPQVPNVVLNALLRRWYLMENRLGHWLPFGSSLLLVARPRPGIAMRE